MFKLIFFLIPVAAISALNVGTSLYDVEDLAYKTWTKDDEIMLWSRRMVDHMIPKNAVDGKLFLDYVKLIEKTFGTIVNDRIRRIVMVSVADAIGGYLQGVMLPRAKDAYYKGRGTFEVTDELHALSRKIKFILDTDGRGWMTPAADAGTPTTAKKSDKGNANDDDDDDDDNDDPIDEETENPCAALLRYGDVPSGGESAAVPLPAFDDRTRPGSLAFPFAVGKRLFPVDRPWLSADDRRPLLVRYYRLAVGCTSPAPQKFREDVHRWLDSVVVPLLADRGRWYPVLAGATRVVRASAKAVASAGAAAGGRHKRKATAAAAATDPNAANGGKDDDVRRSCDDGPDGQLPNSNVSLAVILVSLLSTWLSFLVFGSEQESQTFTYLPT